MTKKQEFIDSITNPLELVKLVSHQSNYFDSYLQYEVKEIKQNRDMAVRVVENFHIFAECYQITPELFCKKNTTGITQGEFKILTDSNSLKLEEVPGGPDDIYPWDTFSIIEDWKIVLLAAMFGALCHGITPRAILEGHNVPYLMEQCAKNCPIAKCPIPKRINKS